jgi:hypothetical protein
MANLSDFLPLAGGGGSSPSNTFQVVGTASDTTSIFSPSTYNLEVGSKIFVILIGGGTGGNAATHSGGGHNFGVIHGNAGSYYQGIYTLTSTADITCLAGAGGAGNTTPVASQANYYNALGTAGNASTLTQESSVILSSDNTTLVGYGTPLDSGTTSSKSLQFLGKDTNSYSSPNWNDSNLGRSIEYGVDGTGAGGQGEYWSSYALGARTPTTSRGKGGLVLIQW